MPVNSYRVKLNQFEGPLDLLLELIENKKIGITEISLAEVTDQYLEYLEGLKEINPGNLASFLVVASRLILIKSRAILPTLEISEEEEQDIHELEERLKEYRLFRFLAKEIDNLDKKRSVSYSRELLAGIGSFFYPPKNIKKAENLLKFLKEVLAYLPQQEILPKDKLKEVISLEDKILELKQRITSEIKHNFNDLVKRKKKIEKIELILTFLAVLELFKQKILTAEQNKVFGEILLTRL